MNTRTDLLRASVARLLLCGALVLLVLTPIRARSLPAAPAIAPLASGDERWSDQFDLWGTNDLVRAMAVDGRGNL
jgi:hypothetical protein